MATTLDLVGVTSLLAGDVAKGAIRYANANWMRIATSMFVIPGLYNVSTQMLKRSDNRIAMLLSPGDREDRRIMVGFKSKYAYRYVGAVSGTNAAVANAMLEGWINKKSVTTVAKDAANFRQGMNLGKVTTIGQVRCTEDRHMTGSILHVSGVWYTLLSLLLQIASIVMFVLTVRERDIAGVALMSANMAAYFLIVFAIACDAFSTPDATPAVGVNQGNVIITDQNNENIWVVNGAENIIQNIAQCEVRTHESKFRNKMEIIAAVMGYATTVATILVTPVISGKSKLYFAIQMIIGLLANMFFSSRDSNSVLEQLTDKYYRMENMKITKFTNRASAVAAAQLLTKGSSENIRETLVPRVGPWTYYRQTLDEIVRLVETNDNTRLRSMIDYFEQNRRFSKVEAANAIARNVPVAAQLMPVGVNPDEDNLNEWPHRLIVDIAEAFAHYMHTRDIILA